MNDNSNLSPRQSVDAKTVPPAIAEMTEELTSALRQYEKCVAELISPLTTLVMYMTPEELEDWARAEEVEIEVYSQLKLLLDEYTSTDEDDLNSQTPVDFILEFV
jgi:hypothetical protein